MNINSPQDWKAWAQSFPAFAPANTPYKSPFTVQNKTADSIEILIYDVIGKDFWSGEGMAAKEFSELLKDVNPKATLTVGILSPGGNVWEGDAISARIEQWQGHTITRNDGMAASIASRILQAGKERQSSSSAKVMIHKAWTIAAGNSDDFEKQKNILLKYDQSLSETYAKRSGKPAADWIAAMSAETYYTAQEAKEAGLIDNILTGDNGGKQNNASNQASANLDAQTSTSQNSPITSPVASISAAVNPPPPNAVKPQPTQNKTMEPTTQPAAAQPAAVDTNAILAAINSLGDKLKPAPALGAEPAAASHQIEVSENELVKQFKAAKYDAVARAKIVAQHPNELRKELIAAQGGGVNPVFAANTVDSALANTLLANTFITTMRTKTAMLNAFTRKIEYTPMAPRDTIKVELVSSSGTVQTNPTSFETGDTTSAPISLAVDHISKSFHVSMAERNVGLALASKAPTNAKIVSEKLVAVVTALMTNANYGADNVIGAATDFDANDLRPILALGKNFDRPTLVLDGSHLSYLLPTDRTKFAFGEEGAYGFDGGLYKNNLWTGGATDIAGFVCSPDAIVWGSAPVANLPQGEFITTENITLDSGIVVQAFTWFSRASRSFWGSFDTCFAAAVGDATQGKVLTTQ